MTMSKKAFLGKSNDQKFWLFCVYNSQILMRLAFISDMLIYWKVIFHGRFRMQFSSNMLLECWENTGLHRRQASTLYPLAAMKFADLLQNSLIAFGAAASTFLLLLGSASAGVQALRPLWRMPLFQRVSRGPPIH